MALERNPAVCNALKEEKTWEVASHGYRWIDYQHVDEDTEREHIRRTVQIHERVLGKRPAGIYQGKVSLRFPRFWICVFLCSLKSGVLLTYCIIIQPNVNTRRLVVEEGGFKYDSDSYADDLPYWVLDHGKPHLVIPYTLSENDMKFCSNLSTGADFFQYLKETLK